MLILLLLIIFAVLFLVFVEEYLGKCRFNDCTHRTEPGCAVLEAVADGRIPRSRHESYVRLWEQANLIKDWETK